MEAVLAQVLSGTNSEDRRAPGIEGLGTIEGSGRASEYVCW